MHNRHFIVLFLWLGTTGCEQGTNDLGTPVREREEGVATAGDRLRPLRWVLSDGATSAAGLWDDSERGEVCSVVELPEGARCLPIHRNQMALPDTFSSKDCVGPRALRVSEPGYLLEGVTGRFYHLVGPTESAWEMQGKDCVPVPGEEQWYTWEEVGFELFVSAELQ